jgi:hypothetical protein
MAKLLSTSLRGSNYGTLPLDNGGTGLTSTGAAGNVLTSTGTAWISAPAPISLPSFTGNSGKYLTTDGTGASWVAGTGSGTLVLSTSPTLSTSIITASTTFSLIDTAATTVNFAGAATSLSIGAGTGTTTINNELHVAGDIYFNGSVNKLNATNIELTDSLIYLSVNNPANIVDIGIIGAYTSASTHLHTGFFRDASDSNIWKLVSGLTVEPSTTVDLTGATFDTLQVGPLIATSLTAGRLYLTTTSTASAGTTTTLVNTSTERQILTGSLSHTYQLPNATTLANGANFYFNNNCTAGSALIKSSSSNTLATALYGASVELTLLDNTTADGIWDVHSFAPSSVQWGDEGLTYSGLINATATAITQVPATFSGYSASQTADLFNIYTYSGGTKSVYITAAGTLKLATALAVADGGTGVTTSTGSGSVVLSTSPTLVTPALGTPTSGNFSTGTFTWPTFNQNTTGTAAGLSTTLAVTSGGTGVTTSTGTGSVVLSTSPTLVTPVLGTPASGDFSTGTFTWPTFNQNTTGTAAGLSTTLAVTSGGTGVTTSTGSGNNVLSTSPTLVSPILGTPTSGDLTNCTNAVGYSLKSDTTTISISTATAPTTGQVLTATSGTAASWQTIDSLPTQTGNASKYLTTDGTNASWAFFTGLTPTSVKTSSYTAQSNDLVRCNTTGGAFTVVFPGTPTDGTTIGVIDINETFGQYNLTLTPTNAFIEGDANGYILDITGTYVSFIYNISTNNWRLLVTPTPSAAGTSQSAASKSMALSIIFGGI